MVALPSVPPVERTIGGVGFVDAFVALEEDAPDVLQWQLAQSERARELLRGSMFDSLSKRVAQVLVDTRVFAPECRGGRWFGLALAAGAQQPVLQVADEPGGPVRVLVDPNALSAERGTSVSLDFSFPSPDGSRVAYGLSSGGNEAAVVHVVDVASGRVLPDRVPLTMASVIAWTPAADAFYFAAADATSPTLQLVLYRHVLGGATERVPDQPTYRHPVVMPQLSADGRLLAALVDHLAPRPDHVLDLETGLWSAFLEQAEGALQGAFVDRDYIAISTHQTPRGHVVAVPLDAGQQRERWRELIPQSDAVLRNLAVAGSPGKPLLVVSALVDAASRITVHEADGSLRHELPLPERGTAGTSGIGYNLPYGPMTTAGPSSKAACVFTSFASSPRILLADLETGDVQALTEPAVVLDGITTHRLEARSADGTPVPYTVVRSGESAVPTAALLYGYGGFNVAFTPGFLEQFTPFVEAGGLAVYCQLRGGGEYGADWWQGGRLHAKQHTFDDLYAIAEDLVQRGLADPDRLACMGGSNGGLLTAVAGVQRPELWSAVVSDRPVLDLLSVGRDPYTLAAVAADYGVPMSPADAPVLAAYSPFHNVQDGVAYPPTLVICGANDPRCPAWHGRKHVARLQEASSSAGPALLRVWEDSGHLGLDATTQIEKHAEWLGFVLERVGLLPPD